MAKDLSKKPDPAAPILFMLFDVNTRELLPRTMEASSIHLVDIQIEDDPHLGWVMGHWNPKTHVVDADGNVIRRPPAA